MTSSPHPDARFRAPLPTKLVMALPPGAYLARYLQGLKHGVRFIQSQYPDSPHVVSALEASIAAEKAAVSGMGLGDAPDLVTSGVLDPATALLLTGQSALQAALSRARVVPPNVPVPRQLEGGSGGGPVAPGDGVPVVRDAFDTVSLTPVLWGSLAVFSDTLLRAPGVESVLVAALLRAVGRVETKALIDPTVAASASHPAAITHDATEITTTGDLAEDLAAMVNAIGSSGSALTWILSPQMAALVQAALGGADVPRSILGLPMVSLATAGRQITLVDFAEVIMTARPIDVQKSNDATVEMENSPTQSVGSPPVGTAMISLWQTNTTGFKISRLANWEVAREGAVVWMNVAAGSPA